MNWLRGLLVVLGGVFEMSEMKLEIKDDADFEKAMAAYWSMRGYSDLEKVRAALEAYVPKIERTIAEAVAAERERIAAIWDVKAETALECMKSSGKDGHHFQQIYKSRLEIAEAIRSAAK